MQPHRIDYATDAAAIGGAGGADQLAQIGRAGRRTPEADSDLADDAALAVIVAGDTHALAGIAAKGVVESFADLVASQGPADIVGEQVADL